MSATGGRDADQMSTVTDSTYLISEAVSHASSPSVISNGTVRSGASGLRVYVTLMSGERLLVPVPVTATIQDLKFQALRRAAKLGVSAALSDTVVRTTGRHAALIDDQDLVSDFVDLTEDNTFTLDVLNTAMTTPAPTEGPSQILPIHLKAPANDGLHVQSALVFVRLITLDDAIKASKLQRIPALSEPFPISTTLNEFHESLLLHYGNPPGLRMWLKDCPIHGRGNLVTMEELGLAGTPQQPLDVFVHVINQKRAGLSASAVLGRVAGHPRDQWGLDATQRGVSTFSTCLDILFDDIDNGNIELETVLDVLLEMTHFPPAIVAFRKLYETSGGLQSGRASLDAFLLLAELFSAVCASMVPEWICSSAESKLEGCRAVFAWLRTVCINAKVLDAPKHTHKIQIFASPVGDFVGMANMATFNPPEMVELHHGTMRAAGSARTHLAVSLETLVPGLGRRLLLAGQVSEPAGVWEYFFQLGGKEWTEFLSSHALHRPGPADYDNLMLEANRCPTFRMVGPTQLGSCLSAQLPVITLSPKGFVSKYDQRDYECSEREFYTWNPVEGEVALRNVNPGEFLSRALQPVIRERQKAGSWEVDAWAEWTEQANHGDPDEAIVICVDVSGSMGSMMKNGWNPTRDSRGETATRLAEVKEFFNNFSTRLSGYGLNTSVGLVTFASRSNVVVAQPLTALQLDFRDRLANANASGSTAIFNAIDTAKGMLVAQKLASPRTKCRIVLFTDGEDNQSSVAPATLCCELYDEGIVLDAIVIGTDSTRSLFKLARSTGGYAFRPRDQQVFFQIFLLETFIDIRTRPDAQTADIRHEDGWDAFEPKPADMEDQYSFPPCRPHPNQNDYFISLNDAQRFWRRKELRSVASEGAAAAADSMSSTASTLNGSTATTSTMGTRVLLSEVKAMVEHPNPNLSVFVSERNVGFWKIVMKGPEDSPYQRGTWLLYCDLGLNFPREPPAVRFITPILHPNISKHGRVCHPIFDREWSNNIHVYEVLNQIYGMLMSLESRDAIDPISALKFYTDPAAGRRLVSEYITRFASRSRAELEGEIVSGDDASSFAPSSRAGDDDARSVASDATIQASPRASSGSSKGGWSFLSGGSRTSSISGYLANQRGPGGARSAARPPPLMATEGQASVRSLPLTEGNLANVPGSGAGGAGSRGTNEGSGSGRRLGRRASFFGMLKRAGSTK